MKNKGAVPPSLRKLRGYDVNRAGQVEGIYQPLYDYQLYPAAGITQMTFFATPIGQNGNTFADTNMESAGQMPAPKEQLVTNIQVVVLSGFNPVSTAGGVAPPSQWNDVFSIFKSGYLDFFIGSKSYLTDAPLGKFSNDFRLAGSAALSDTTASGTTELSKIDYATFAGPMYEITPTRLVSNQNFNVTLNWPTAVPLPSNDVETRIGVILGGFLYRLSQ